MQEKQGGESWVEEDKPKYDREKVARDLAKLADANGGEYGESLRVDSAGRVMCESRNGDEAPALLPLSLERRDGSDPSIEDIYQALRDFGDALPGYEISINEDRTAGILEYRIKRKTFGVRASG